MTTPPSFSRTQSLTEALDRAAELCGLEREFWDIWGHRHVASTEAVQAILTSMGLPAHEHAALDAALEERLWRQWSLPVPETLVLPVTGAGASIPVSVPRDFGDVGLGVEIQWEDGFVERARVSLAGLPTLDEANLRGRPFVRKRLPLPHRLRPGYHTLTVELQTTETDALRYESRLILHPERCHQPEALADGKRSAGIAVSLYGLRSDRNWGCGDFTDLHRLTDWAAASVGGACIALNPLHSIPNRQPYNTSPYLPNCSFYRNPLYLDVERVPEFAHCPEARALLADPAVQSDLAALRASRHVEYERVYALKLRVLRLLFRTFLEREAAADSGRARDFQAFVCDEGALLRDYAVYCALDDAIHRRHPDVWLWTDWPEPYRDPRSAETKAFAEEHAEQVQFHEYLQWLIDGQLREAQAHARERGLTIGLYHDLALATDRYGSDLWAHRDFYVEGCRVGAPPDDFSPKGQDWSFPPPDSERHRADGYRLFAESIRKNCRHGGALRIDHVMRFFRLYWIPDGQDATRGVYVRDRAEELLGVLALESVRNQVAVIGEDLGTVAPAVRETLARFGVLSYRLLYFEKDKEGRFRLPSDYPTQALVSASTHDLPTLAGFWTGRDIVARREAGLLPDDASFQSMRADREREKQKLLDALHGQGLLPAWYPRVAREVPEFDGHMHAAAVGFLVTTPSALMVLNQEDLFKDPDQQNLPGSTEQYPNWRHKMRFRLEELETEPFAQGCAMMLKGWLRHTERA